MEDVLEADKTRDRISGGRLVQVSRQQMVSTYRELSLTLRGTSKRQTEKTVGGWLNSEVWE